MHGNVVLETRGITKRFPGVLALDQVDFELQRGEVHALVGENGAGKSTLMNILSGVHRQDQGTIHLRGEKVGFRDPLDAARRGIGIVFQELSLAYGLSVAENIFTNRQPVNFLGLVRYPRLYQNTRNLMQLFDEDINPKSLVKNLSIAKQQVVEILKAISTNPEILILDEPTSSLTQHETEKLFENIARLKEQGIAIIYISHHIQEIFEIADRATVLRDGKHIQTVNVSDVTEDEIVGLMVGRRISHEYVDRADRINWERPMLRVEHLHHPKYFRDISFEVHQGEILSFSGLVGAGRSEIARTIFGLEPTGTGTVHVDNERIEIRSPGDAVRAGIVYTSENRKLEGLFLDMSLRENFVVPRLREFARGPLGILAEKEIDAYSHRNIARYDIAAASVRQRIRNLSGGNQQKSLIAMWLGLEPKVVIVDEPTKGVDVGAKGEIYQILRDLADQGNAVLVISSDLLEVLAISDRIIVVRSGEIAGSLMNAEASEEKVIGLATGVG